MVHSPALKALLFNLRQHEAFDEFKRAVEAPRLPKFIPSKGETIEVMGAKTVFVSGQMHQQERWIVFLTGEPERETETSQQE